MKNIIKITILVIAVLSISTFAGEYIDLIPDSFSKTMIYSKNTDKADSIKFTIVINWKDLKVDTKLSSSMGTLSITDITNASVDTFTVVVAPNWSNDKNGDIKTVDIVATATGIILDSIQVSYTISRDNSFADSSEIVIYENVIDPITTNYIFPVTDKNIRTGSYTIRYCNDRSMLFFSSNGFSKYSDKEFSTYQIPMDPLLAPQIHVEKNGTLWAQSAPTSDSIFVYSPGKSEDDHTIFDYKAIVGEKKLLSWGFDRNDRMFMNVTNIDQTKNYTYVKNGDDWLELNHYPYHMIQDNGNLTLYDHAGKSTFVFLVFNETGYDEIHCPEGPFEARGYSIVPNGTLYIWGGYASSELKIARFDGTFWSSYGEASYSNPKGIISDLDWDSGISGITATSNGGVWIRYKSYDEYDKVNNYTKYYHFGATYFDGDSTWTHYTKTSNSFPHKEVNGVREFTGMGVWLSYKYQRHYYPGTAGWNEYFGLSKQSSSKLNSANLGLSSKDFNVSDIYQRTDSTLYMAGGYSMFSYAGYSWDYNDLAKHITFKDKEILTHYSDGEGNVWYLFKGSSDIARVTPKQETSIKTKSVLKAHNSLPSCSFYKKTLHIQGINSDKVKIKIISLNGRVVQKANLPITLGNVDYTIKNNLAKGIYIAHIETDYFTMAHKIHF